MDELERRDLKGRFLSSKQKNTIAVLDHDHTYVTGKLMQIYISLFKHSYFNCLITDTRNFIN